MFSSKFFKKASIFGLATTASVLTLGASNSAQAAILSYTGTFDGDDDVDFFPVSLAETGFITAQTFSYGGGTQVDGNVVSRGGFDPIIGILDSVGNLVLQSDDGTGNGDPDTGVTYDTFIQASDLAPGNYTVFIAQYDNFYDDDNANDFNFTADPTFTSVFGCSNGQFCDFTEANRSNEYAIDISNTENITTEPVPEPVTILGSVIALGVGSIFKKKRQEIK